MIPSESANNLNVDLGFYEKYSFKVLRDQTQIVSQRFGLSLKLESVYYPWNRTFEIGLIGNHGSNMREQEFI